ncbi:MAG: hypothetical protein N2651_00945 [Fimbriimonadales bacterium]|nr:hypothetical protein [Fimbriimonadales bacterium]
MNMMRFWALSLGVTSLLMFQPTAQQARPQTAQQVLERMAQAMGVAQAAKIRTIQLTGAMQSPAQGLQGRYEVFYKAPDKVLVKTTIQGLGEVLQAYDGKVGWAKDPMMGLRELKGAELEQIRQSAESGVQNDIRKVIRNPKLTGQEKVGNHTAHVITAQSRSGSPIKVYIDTQRYLLLRMDMQAPTPQGSINVATFFEDYRKVDGVMYAFTTRQSASGVEAVTKVERVRHNTPIDDAIFRKPKN